MLLPRYWCCPALDDPHQPIKPATTVKKWPLSPCPPDSGNQSGRRIQCFSHARRGTFGRPTEVGGRGQRGAPITLPYIHSHFSSVVGGRKTNRMIQPPNLSGPCGAFSVGFLAPLLLLLLLRRSSSTTTAMTTTTTVVILLLEAIRFGVYTVWSVVTFVGW